MPQSFVLDDRYKVVGYLGNCPSAIYFEVEDKDGSIYTMKRFYITGPMDVRKAAREVEILDRLCYEERQSPFVMHLLQSFAYRCDFCLILEKFSEFTLLKLVDIVGPIRKKDEALFYACEVMSGLKYLQDTKVVHRALRLEHIFLKENGHIVIGGFEFSYDLAKRVGQDLVFEPPFEEYLPAPEIDDYDYYDMKLDIWFYGLFLGHLIFGNDCRLLSYLNLTEGCVRFPQFLESLGSIDVDKAFIDVINSCCQYYRDDLNKQMSMELFRDIDWKKVERLELEPPYKPEELRKILVSRGENTKSDFTDYKFLKVAGKKQRPRFLEDNFSFEVDAETNEVVYNRRSKRGLRDVGLTDQIMCWYFQSMSFEYPRHPHFEMEKKVDEPSSEKSSSTTPTSFTASSSGYSAEGSTSTVLASTGKRVKKRRKHRRKKLWKLSESNLADLVNLSLALRHAKISGSSFSPDSIERMLKTEGNTEVAVPSATNSVAPTTTTTKAKPSFELLFCEKVTVSSAETAPEVKVSSASPVEETINRLLTFPRSSVVSTSSGLTETATEITASTSSTATSTTCASPVEETINRLLTFPRSSVVSTSSGVTETTTEITASTSSTATSITSASLVEETINHLLTFPQSNGVPSSSGVTETTTEITASTSSTATSTTCASPVEETIYQILFPKSAVVPTSNGVTENTTEITDSRAVTATSTTSDLPFGETIYKLLMLSQNTAAPSVNGVAETTTEIKDSSSVTSKNSATLLEDALYQLLKLPRNDVVPQYVPRIGSYAPVPDQQVIHGIRLDFSKLIGPEVMVVNNAASIPLAMSASNASSSQQTTPVWLNSQKQSDGLEFTQQVLTYAPNPAEYKPENSETGAPTSTVQLQMESHLESGRRVVLAKNAQICPHEPQHTCVYYMSSSNYQQPGSVLVNPQGNTGTQVVCPHVHYHCCHCAQITPHYQQVTPNLQSNNGVHVHQQSYGPNVQHYSAAPMQGNVQGQCATPPCQCVHSSVANGVPVNPNVAMQVPMNQPVHLQQMSYTGQAQVPMNHTVQGNVQTVQCLCANQPHSFPQSSVANLALLNQNGANVNAMQVPIGTPNQLQQVPCAAVTSQTQFGIDNIACNGQVNHVPLHQPPNPITSPPAATVVVDTANKMPAVHLPSVTIPDAAAVMTTLP